MQIKLIFTTKVLEYPQIESESFGELEMAYTVETKQPLSPVFSLSLGMTVTVKFAMAATTKPITTTFFRPNLTKKSKKKLLSILPFTSNFSSFITNKDA